MSLQSLQHKHNKSINQSPHFVSSEARHRLCSASYSVKPLDNIFWSPESRWTNGSIGKDLKWKSDIGITITIKSSGTYKVKLELRICQFKTLNSAYKLVVTLQYVINYK